MPIEFASSPGGAGVEGVIWLGASNGDNNNNPGVVGNLTISVPIIGGVSGGAGLTKGGEGALILSGASTIPR